MSMLQYQTWWELWVGQFLMPFPKKSGHIKFVLYLLVVLIFNTALLNCSLSFIQTILCGKRHVGRGCNYLVLSGGVEEVQEVQNSFWCCALPPPGILTNQGNHYILSQWDFLAHNWHKKSNHWLKCGRKLMIFLFSLLYKMFLLFLLNIFCFCLLVDINKQMLVVMQYLLIIK